MRRGDCFEAVLSFAMARDLDGDRDRWTVCHGVVESTLPPTEGIRHVHAWIEYEQWGVTFVRNVATGNEMETPACIYYDAGRITKVVRYTVAEAMKAALEHDHYGPWDEALNRVQDAALTALAAREEEGEHDGI
jgi:hypothetical protein